MFGNIFNEEDVALNEAIEESKRLQSGIPDSNAPDRPRAQCQLAGINNQGATCYLNSLLQTLFFTPEFREALFHLSERELGRLEDKDKPGHKVRVIPLQLKRLFLRLLLSNRQSISTTELTESFGWTNREESQQHDVQELNRILFLAIEESLAGTRRSNLIKELYHGKVVNQITCTECGKISEIEEDFQDLTVTVGGVESLELGLRHLFCDIETMEGKNQYRCEICHKLVVAQKATKIRSLPPILTVSLLRFSYNFKKMERYKETGRFSFPISINMSDFLEEEMSREAAEYELFSVVIHRGCAHGGHYHAYIRDVDNLGHWINPESFEAVQPTKSETDIIQFTSPVDLCYQIVSRQPHKVLSTNKLCVEICKHTGQSWNKLFKKKYGSINKFFKTYDDKFTLNQDAGVVSLKEDNEQRNQKNKFPDFSKDTEYREIKKDVDRSFSPRPAEGHCWYNFDDAVVTPIREKDIEKQFAGKESAYMLFYRKKSLIRPEEAMGNPVYQIPDNLLTEISQENSELEKQRLEYENIVNTITIQIHFCRYYKYAEGALKKCGGNRSFTDLAMDRRQTVKELVVAVEEIGGELVPKHFVIHRMQDLPAGFHLYDEITEDRSKKLLELCIDNDSKLFIWNGSKVKDQVVPVGACCEPILLTIIHGNPEQFVCGFPKNMAFDEFRSYICDLTEMNFSTVVLKKLVGRDAAMHMHILKDSTATLEELQFKDGDQIIVEDRNSVSLSEKAAARQNSFVITVLNQCGEYPLDGSWPKATVFVNSDMPLLKVKRNIIDKFGIQEVAGGGRLRVCHNSLGMRTPLHDELSVGDAGITNKTVLVLEHGKAPEKNQITLTVSPADPKSNFKEIEITVERNMTVRKCLKNIIQQYGQKGDAWHLRKTNWCGEAADLIDDLDLSLEDSLINDGDHILFKEGKLPPKGFFYLPIYLHSPNQSSGIINSIANSIQGLMSKIISTPNSTCYKSLVHLGDVEVSKEATLKDLKSQILLLPQVSDLRIPTPDFLRVRLVNNNQLSAVLRVLNQSIRRQKVTSSSQIAVQVLTFEEQLSQHEMILAIKERNPHSRVYGPEKELVWNTSHGADARSLRQSIADMLMVKPESILIAKHFPQKYMWLPIKEISQPKPDNQKGKRKCRMSKQPCLKHSPYHISDGDVIGVKHIDYICDDTEDDFATAEDDAGQEEIQREAEEKRKMREERQMFSDGNGSRKQKPEVPLKIRVANFT